MPDLDLTKQAEQVTGAGTFEFEPASGVYTELQCGAYIFMDADYRRNLGIAAINLEFYSLNYQFANEINFSSLRSVFGGTVH